MVDQGEVNLQLEKSVLGKNNQTVQKSKSRVALLKQHQPSLFDMLEKRLTLYEASGNYFCPKCSGVLLSVELLQVGSNESASLTFIPKEFAMDPSVCQKSMRDTKLSKIKETSHACP